MIYQSYKMYINLSNIPNWGLNNSDFLKTIYEDCFNEIKDENNKLYYIPFLNQYDHSYDFSQLFQKNNCYINIDFYFLIYRDILQFLDYIGFNIPFYKLIEPKDYEYLVDILKQNEELYNHIKENIKGVQHYAFHIKEFNHNIYLFDYDFKNYNSDKYTNNLDFYIKESIEYDDYEWILWFIINVNNLRDYEDLLFEFDYTNVSIKTFDLLYNINNEFYSNICTYIVKYRKSELFLKYINEIKKNYDNEKLLKYAFQREYNENVIIHKEFVKLMLNNGYNFKFIYEYSKNTYYSNNPLLMNYMYENYKELIDKNIIDICHTLHNISLNDNICTLKEKIEILDFFIKNYEIVIKMDDFIHYIFPINNKNDNLEKNEFDLKFILILIEHTGNINNIYSYMIYLYFNYKAGIEAYIENARIKNNYEISTFKNDDFLKGAATLQTESSSKVDISKFKNTFKYVLLFKNVDYIDFYIINKVYMNDTFNTNQYLKYVLYDVNLFKLIYKNKIGNIDLNDYLFLSAYENHNIQIILFMLQERYIPTERVKILIKEDYQQSVEINNVEKRKNIDVNKYFTNIEFEYKEKIYHIICT